jgi:hypothetical protein
VPSQAEAVAEAEADSPAVAERARVLLTLLAVLGCPDNFAVGVTKPWRDNRIRDAKKAKMELARAAHLSGRAVQVDPGLTALYYTPLNL